MHYFDEHIGDTFLAVGTMPLVHHGIYARLKARYMAKEAPLPNKPALLREWTGVRTRAERAALERVLEECFLLDDDDRWRVPKWDEQIKEFQAKQAAAVASEVAQQEKSNNRVRLYRIERRLLTAALVDIECRKGELDDLGMKELRALAVQKLGQERVEAIAAEAAAAVSETVGVTPVVTPVKRGETPPQEPGTAPQKPSHTLQHLGEETGGVGGRETKGETPGETPAETALQGNAVQVMADALTAAGVPAHRSHAGLQELVAKGWTVSTVLAQLPTSWTGVQNRLGWLLAKIANAKAPALPQAASGEAAGGWPETRAGVEAIGMKLGLGKWDEAEYYRTQHESFAQYEARVKRAAGAAEAVA